MRSIRIEKHVREFTFPPRNQHFFHRCSSSASFRADAQFDTQLPNDESMSVKLILPKLRWPRFGVALIRCIERHSQPKSINQLIL